MALTKVSLLDDPLAMSYAANVAGNVSVTRSVSVGYTDGRVPQANLDVKNNVYIGGATAITGKLTSSSVTPAFYGANVTGNASVTRSLAVGYTDGRVPQANLDVKGNTFVSGSFSIPDSSKIQLGNDEDLQIYHNGSHSYIVEGGTGQLYLASSYLSITNAAMSETMAYFNDDAEVALYYDVTKRFETTSTGATITGRTVSGQFGTSTGNSMGDDSVISFTPTVQYGILGVHSVSTDFAWFSFRCQAGGAECVMLSITGRGIATTGILTGTTGTDGRLNVSPATNGNIYIENRLGGATTVGYTVIG